jgi:hypothetical protein
MPMKRRDILFPLTLLLVVCPFLCRVGAGMLTQLGALVLYWPGFRTDKMKRSLSWIKLPNLPNIVRLDDHQICKQLRSRPKPFSRANGCLEDISLISTKSKRGQIWQLISFNRSIKPSVCATACHST